MSSFDFWKGANFKLKLEKLMVIGTMINLNLKACHKSKRMTRLRNLFGLLNVNYRKRLGSIILKFYDELKEKLNRTITGVRSVRDVDKVDIGLSKR